MRLHAAEFRTHRMNVVSPREDVTLPKPDGKVALLEDQHCAKVIVGADIRLVCGAG